MDLAEPIKVGTAGFVRYVDHMGSDDSVVQAARVSYGAGTTKVSDDVTLIRYLMRHRHTTPFEMCEIKLHIKVPMHVWRQWIRHRTASVNEYSTRYSEALDDTELTAANGWRLQSTTNKQGSSASTLPDELGEAFSKREGDTIAAMQAEYKLRLASGIAREQARKDLPLSTYTEAYWKCDLHNTLHFLSLRLDKHAQLEIRQFAQAVAAIVKQLFPVSWGAFKSYRLNARTLSQEMIDLLRVVLRDEAIEQQLKTLAPEYISTGRERQEFFDILYRAFD